MKTSTITLSVRFRQFCLWPAAMLTLMRIRIPKWMIAVEIVK